MRAPFRILLLSLTAFLIATAIVTRYRHNVYLQATSTDWSKLHPSNWVPHFYSSGRKAEVEEQWRAKEKLLSSEDKEDGRTSGLGSAGGSGEDNMSDEQRAKALQRLKNQYGDDETDKEPSKDKESSKESEKEKKPIEEAEEGEYDLAIDQGSDLEAESASSSSTGKAATKTIGSGSKGSSGSSSESEGGPEGSGEAVSNTTKGSTPTGSGRVVPTTFATSISKSGSFLSSIFDEFAYLADLKFGPHASTSSLHNYPDVVVVATESPSPTSLNSDAGFAALEDAEAEDEFGYLDFEDPGEKDTIKKKKPTPEELHEYEDLRDLSIE